MVDRIVSGEVSDRSSLSARSYHLVGTETVRAAASRASGYLRGAWEAWQEHDAGQRVGQGTRPARERWLLPLLRELGYGQVPALPHPAVVLRAELDAAFFPLYGVDREGADYIMETFPIVKRKDIAAHGSFRFTIGKVSMM